MMTSYITVAAMLGASVFTQVGANDVILEVGTEVVDNPEVEVIDPGMPTIDKVPVIDDFPVPAKPICCRNGGGTEWADIECMKIDNEQECARDFVHKCRWGSTDTIPHIDGCKSEQDDLKPSCCRNGGGTEWADIECMKIETEEECKADFVHKCRWGSTDTIEHIEGCESDEVVIPDGFVVEAGDCRLPNGDMAENHFDGGVALGNKSYKECIDEFKSRYKEDKDLAWANYSESHKMCWIGKDKGYKGNGRAGFWCMYKPEPTAMPTPTPTEFALLDPVICYSLGDPHMRYFDGHHGSFQTRGEFTLWKTDGVRIDVRHGPHLGALTNNQVSTNHGFAIHGDETCGMLYEIYATNGGGMKVTSPGGVIVDNYAGVANIMTGLMNYNCPSITTTLVDDFQNNAPSWVLRNNPVAEFNLDHSRVRVQIDTRYGINIWVEVEGAWYLQTDSGICTFREGYQEQLACQDSLFTEYPDGDCAALIRNEPEPAGECPQELVTAAEKECSLCPKIVDPADCVREVCLMGDIAVAKVFLESCSVGVAIAPPRDVHCVSSGDPHFTYFDGSRRDFQDRGEFTLYEHQNKGIKIQARQGYRPDMPTANHISTNHAVAIGGQWACGFAFEFHYDSQSGQRNIANIRTTDPVLKIRSAGGQFQMANGLVDMRNLLNNLNCQTASASGDVFEFSLNNGAVRVKVQMQWYGINIWIDVSGATYEDKDSGICTKREGGFDQVPCRKSMFTLYKEGDSCDQQERTKIPVVPIENCDPALILEAEKVCGECPNVVSPKDCIFETCAVGDIQAAHDLLEACRMEDILIPVPTSRPTANPDVSCYSAGDPHFKYFNGAYGDFHSRGDFVLYKSNTISVQVRQGPFLGLPPTHPAFNTVSTNNAIAIEGTWTCGIKYEIYATQPQRMIVTPLTGPATTSTGVSNILADVASATCPTVNVNGDIVEFAMLNKMRLRFQVRSWGINVWIDLKGEEYKASDEGICTRREGAYDALNCDESLFSESDDCGNYVEIVNQEVDCDPDLKREATEVCQACPEIVAVKDCVFEACALQTIEAAHELMEACPLGDMIKQFETCGKSGKIAKRGATKLKRAVRKVLKGRRAVSACACANACEQVGGTEFQFKERNNKCSCYKGAKKITYGKNKKHVVGTLKGSVAKEISE